MFSQQTWELMLIAAQITNSWGNYISAETGGHTLPTSVQEPIPFLLELLPKKGKKNKIK